MHAPVWAWTAFVVLILALLAVDLLGHRGRRSPSVREAALWSGFWIALALVFGLVLTGWQGWDTGADYFSGYLIEKSLSIDNVFVFAVIFSSFAVPVAHQRRVLFFGVIGALVLRALFIAGGAALLDAVHAAVYAFGALLLLTAVKVLRSSGMPRIDPQRSPVLRVFRRIVPSIPEFAGDRFVVRRGGRRYATPLLAVLLVIEATDVVFALDSIPAVFAVTTDTFVVFSSNVFALLGLRALYFLLAGAAERFAHLHIGLGLILIFAGAKMILSDVWHLPTWSSLVIIAVILGGTLALSRRHPAPVADGSGEHSPGEHSPGEHGSGEHGSGGHGTADLPVPDRISATGSAPR